MTTNKLKTVIAAIYAALAAMVTAGQLTEADKTALAPVIIASLLAKEAIEV